MASDQGGDLASARFAERGLAIALIGLCVGEILGSVLVVLYGAASHHPSHPSTFGSDVFGLVGIWAGFIGAAVLALRPSLGSVTGWWRRFVLDYGLQLRLWPDVPLGIAAGFAGQFVVVPLFELILVPFVPHVFNRLGGPAMSLTAHVHGAGLVVVGLLVCLGSPLVEELFFRGLALRRLGEALSRRRVRHEGVIAVAATSIVFGLAHFEALQLLGLIGFGALLGALAWRSGRLGPNIVAHITFNAIAYIALVTKL